VKKTKTTISIMILVIASLIPSISNANGYVDPSCHVYVHIYPHASTITIKGQTFTRQNPDGTYYPGDAFDFGILVSWTQNCWSIYPKPIQASGLTIGNIQQGPVSYDDQGNGHYYEYGHAEIGTTTSSARLSQVVVAFGLVCGIDKCYKGYTSGGDSYSPPIIKPQVTIALKFENFTDHDGYKMRNGDGTYYVWDGINIVFDPHYKWKNERFGTIDTHTDSRSDIPLIGSYECHQRNCSYTFSKPAIEPWSYNFEYEEGHTAYNSTTLSDIHRHVFYYHTTVYNLGRKIGEGDNSITALVVQYEPVYKNYPYAVLKDSSWWGFGKRPAVALDYYGSVGGGQDDGSSVIHPDRRSKINSFVYTSFAYKILTPVPLNQSMTWSGSYPANFVDENFSYHDNALQSGKNSAMFVQAGYGKIIFNHPILYTILKTRYDNSTIINTLQSSNFAGFNTYNLTKYYFGYPHTRFSTDVIVIALHSDGSINHIPLHLTMIPDFTENATYEQDFIREKVVHDRDRIFAGIVLDDMYGKQDVSAASGVINMQANLTSMVIPDVYKVFAQNPLDLPLSLVYEQPSPYNVTIAAGTKQLSFLERGFQFDTKWRYVVNMDQDNILNGTRYQGLVNIYPDNNFGPYSQILVDSKVQNVTCTRGCTLLLSDRNANATIEAFNVWGGKASKTFEPDNSIPVPTYHYDTIITAVLILIVAVIGYGFVRRYWKGFAAAFGFGDD
jgi:hypothetical protein